MTREKGVSCLAAIPSSSTPVKWPIESQQAKVEKYFSILSSVESARASNAVRTFAVDIGFFESLVFFASLEDAECDIALATTRENER